MNLDSRGVGKDCDCICLEEEDLGEERSIYSQEIHSIYFLFSIREWMNVQWGRAMGTILLGMTFSRVSLLALTLMLTRD